MRSRLASRAATAATLSDSEDTGLLIRRPSSRNQRLTQNEEIAVLKLADIGKSQKEIAAVIGCSQPAVSQLLTRFTDTSFLAKRTLLNKLQEHAHRVNRKADVDQSIRVLQSFEVMPIVQERSGATAIQINVGMPGQAIGRDPLEVPQTQVLTVGTDKFSQLT